MNIIKDEFALKNFCFDFYKPQVFYLAQWRWPKQVYAGYRILAAIFTASCLIRVFTVKDPRIPHPPLTYLTIWSYIVLVLHLTVAAVIAVVYYALRERNPNVSNLADNRADTVPEPNPEGATSGGTTTWAMKVSWLLSGMSFVSAITVTLVTFVENIFSRREVFEREFLRICLHVLNSVFVFLDVSFGAYPVRLLHVVYSLALGISYSVFSVLYWKFDPKKPVMYSFLDWSRPLRSFGFVFLFLTLCIPLHLFHWLLYRLRLHLYTKLYGDELPPRDRAGVITANV